MHLNVEQMVDDVLLLMSYVVKTPPALRLKRAQSWIPNLGDLRQLSRRVLQSHEL
jgi:hypothetical protein